VRRAREHVNPLGTQGKQLIDIAFGIRHHRQRMRFGKPFRRDRKPGEPTIRFLLRKPPPAILLTAAFAAVPDLDIDKPKQAAISCVHRNRRMHQNPARRPAAAHRPKTRPTDLTMAEHNFARVLDHHHIAGSHTLARACPNRRRHLRDAHPPIAQKSMELNLAPPASGQPANARAGRRHQCTVQQHPPFSRRQSPNRPSSKAISINTSITIPRHGVTPPPWGQPRCVNMLATFVGVTNGGA
jgi:hypothetical protein